MLLPPADKPSRVGRAVQVIVLIIITTFTVEINEKLNSFKIRVTANPGKSL